MKKAVVLCSGGMDSLITTAIAHRDNDQIFLLHANYGQRTQDKELKSFQEICSYFKPEKHMIVDIDYLLKIGGSSLTDDRIMIPKNQHGSSVPNTYVPFRNANLLSIATSWAEVTGAEKIYIGAVEVDGSGYPDCRKVFYDAMEQAINQGTKEETHIAIETPIIHLKKSEIIKIGQELNIPFELSWSCYERNDVACGECDSCILRINAFQEAKIKDPIPYAIDIDWRLS